MNHMKLIDIIYSLSEKCSVHRKRHLKKLNISNAEFNALGCLDNQQKITCKEFSERMGLSFSRGSRIIDKLYKKKYVERMDSPSDRRCKVVLLTSLGKKAREQIHKEKNKCEHRLTKEISKEKLAQLKKDLMDLITKL